MFEIMKKLTKLDKTNDERNVWTSQKLNFTPPRCSPHQLLLHGRNNLAVYARDDLSSLPLTD